MPFLCPKSGIIALALGLLASFPAQATLSLTPFASGLAQPVFLTAPAGDTHRQFILERAGTVRVVQDGVLLPTPFLDISSEVSTDTDFGMLGMAFAPDYMTSGIFYLEYSNETPADPEPLYLKHVSRFHALGDPATSNSGDAASEQPVLTVQLNKPQHQAGMIAFGPNDGYLYVSIGDGSEGIDFFNEAQSTNTMMGKMLRIDVNGSATYTVPATNPFVGQSGVLEEIWSYGFRNPFRWSFDRQTGDLFIGDVGQDLIEELDFQAAASTGGQNYGWHIFEGNRCDVEASGVTQDVCDATAPSVTFPIYTYPHTVGHSIIGGYVYRGNAIPSMKGVYFFADFIVGSVSTLNYDGTTVTNLTDRSLELDPAATQLKMIDSFGEDALGELYVISISGNVYKIVSDEIPAEGEGEGAPEGEGEGATEGEGEGATEGEGEGATEGEGEGAAEVEGEGAAEGEGEGAAEGEGEGAAEGEGEGAEGEGQHVLWHHAADESGDFVIQLGELLRVVQFYNSSGYHCDAGTEDGFDVGQGDEVCMAHSSDYSPQDWHISLNELLRLIQLFNAKGYHVCAEGEDGYCPGL